MRLSATLEGSPHTQRAPQLTLPGAHGPLINYENMLEESVDCIGPDVLANVTRLTLPDGKVLRALHNR